MQTSFCLRENSMKNFEKYINKIISIMNNKGCNGSGKKCGRCIFNDGEEFCLIFGTRRDELKRFLLEEYKEPIQLSHDEYVILKNVDSEYKWIARHKNKKLYLFTDKPRKNYSFSLWTNEKYDSYFYHFSHLFQFVKWEDEEPYNIQELVENYEKEHKDV